MLSVKKIPAEYKLFVTPVVTLILFNVILISLPLTNILGYEFSAFNALVITFLSGIFIIRLFKIPFDIKENASRKKYIFRAFSIFLFIPFIISLIHMPFSVTCSFTDGVLFYIVLTVPAVIIGGALGFLTIAYFTRFRIIIFIIIYLIILSIPLVEFYINPQVYFYNPIFGYFPGTIYDEGLSVTGKLATYRLFNLIFFGSIFLFFYLRSKYVYKKIIKLMFIIGIVFLSALFILISPFIGYSTTFQKLNLELKGKVITPHFIIHYPEKLDTTIVKAIALHHEYYYHELKNFFKDEPQNKISSYLFLNVNQKKTLFGSGRADVAKVWMNSTFITYDNYDITLKHEIAHIFSANFGTGLFKVAAGLNPSLIEGIATAAAPVFNENNIDYLAVLAYKGGFGINLNSLFKGYNFFTHGSNASYVYAGSFTKYLIELYGINKFKKIYKTLNFESVYGKTLAELSLEYEAFLNSQNISFNINKAYYYFGYKSIFYKLCPRYVADRLKDGWAKYNSGNITGANEIFENIFAKVKNYSALSGLAVCKFKLGQKQKAISLLKEHIQDFNRTTYYYNLELLLADILAESKAVNSADSIYREIIIQNPNRTLYYLSNMRYHLSLDDSLLTLYLGGSSVEKFSILKEVNQKEYDYNSIPVVIDLAKYLGEKYTQTLTIFRKTIRVYNYPSSYAVYKLSNYMIENLDFDKARKMAALASRYDLDKNFNFILKSNYDKMNWIYNNARGLLNEFQFL